MTEQEKIEIYYEMDKKFIKDDLIFVVEAELMDLGEEDEYSKITEEEYIRILNYIEIHIDELYEKYTNRISLTETKQAVLSNIIDDLLLELGIEKR